MALYAKASWQRVGEWGTNLVTRSGARYAREDRNPWIGVNYKPLLLRSMRRKRETSLSAVRHADNPEVLHPNLLK